MWLVWYYIQHFFRFTFSVFFSFCCYFRKPGLQNLVRKFLNISFAFIFYFGKIFFVDQYFLYRKYYKCRRIFLLIYYLLIIIFQKYKNFRTKNLHYSCPNWYGLLRKKLYQLGRISGFISALVVFFRKFDNK